MPRHSAATEATEQECLLHWVALHTPAYPELALLYHIPNGGKRTKSEAARFKRQGVKAGVPDLCLPVARHGYHSLYIELKAGGNKPTARQARWIKALMEEHHMAVTCTGWESAARRIMWYMGMHEDALVRAIRAGEKKR